MSLLKASAALADLGVGQRLEIVGTDNQTKQELFKILDLEEFSTIEVQKQKAFYRIILEKTSG